MSEVLKAEVQNEMDFDDYIDSLVADIREQEKIIFDIKQEESKLRTQKKKAESVKEQKRQTIEQEMREYGVVSSRQCVLKRVAPAPIIIDESKIPEEFIKITRSIDKVGINKAIANGRTIEGVGMSNGGETLALKG